MNKENKKNICIKIGQHGDFLKGKLPNHPNHKSGRNPYAHICSEIKKKYKKSYKDISDKYLDEIIEFINSVDK